MKTLIGTHDQVKDQLAQLLSDGYHVNKKDSMREEAGEPILTYILQKPVPKIDPVMLNALQAIKTLQDQNAVLQAEKEDLQAQLDTLEEILNQQP